MNLLNFPDELILYILHFLYFSILAKLNLACKKNERLRHLVLDKTIKEKFKKVTLFEPTKEKKINEVNLLLELDSNKIDLQNEHGATGLIMACKDKNENLVK